MARLEAELAEVQANHAAALEQFGQWRAKARALMEAKDAEANALRARVAATQVRVPPSPFRHSGAAAAFVQPLALF